MNWKKLRPQMQAFVNEYYTPNKSWITRSAKADPKYRKLFNIDDPGGAARFQIALGTALKKGYVALPGNPPSEQAPAPKTRRMDPKPPSSCDYCPKCGTFLAPFHAAAIFTR